MRKQAKGTRRRKRSRQEKSNGAGAPPLFGARPVHFVALPGEPATEVLVWLRRLDKPFAEFEEHVALLPPDWSDILELDEGRRAHEFVRRARAFVCAGGKTIEEQERRFASEDYGGGAFLCWILRALDERRMEIRVESQHPVPIDGVTAVEWSAATEREVLDLVQRYDGKFRVPPPAPGGWAYDGNPETSWNRTPIWANGEAPGWAGWAEATLQQIDLARRADANGWTERARFHERRAVECLTKLRAFDDARAGRLASLGGRTTSMTPEQEDAAIEECARRKAAGEKLLTVEGELARRYGVSARTIRELRRRRGHTRHKALGPPTS